MKKTKWYPAKIKPVRIGVYERRYKNVPLSPLFCLWNGRFWCPGSFDKEFAAYYDSPSYTQNLPWRGIAKGKS